MRKLTNLAAAAVAASLFLTACGSEDSKKDDAAGTSGNTSEKSEAAETESLDATSARALTEKLVAAVDCTSATEYPDQAEIDKTNEDMGTELLDATFCGIEKPTKVAYFFTVSEEEDDFETVSDYFTDQAKKDKVDVVQHEVTGDSWQVLVIAEGKVPANIDQIEDDLETAAGR